MRARNIKPGFFKNEELVELPALTRILFQGLWCMADREGRLEDRPRRIKMEVLPADDIDVDTALQSLHDHGLVIRYEVDDLRYISIPNFLKHQTPHPRETQSTIPAPINMQGNAKDTPSTRQYNANYAAKQCQDRRNPDILNPDILNPESCSSSNSTREDNAADDIPDPLDPTPADPVEAAVQQVLREFIPCGLSEPVPRIADEIETMMILPEYGLDPPTRSALVVRAMQAVKDLDKDKRHWGTVKGLIRHWQKNGERPPGGKQPTPSNRLFDNYLDGG